MSKVITGTFDGQVLKLDSPADVGDLEPLTRYRITLELLSETVPESPGGDAWDLLMSLAGTIEAPEDWAAEHDHYHYGTPKLGIEGSG
jgi:hypothetical protein